MENSFMEILREHRNRYPLMEPQDYGKLIFQSVFGPEHMVTDPQAVREYMREELSSMCQEKHGEGSNICHGRQGEGSDTGQGKQGEHSGMAEGISDVWETFSDMAQSALPKVPEDIGNGLCRFPLWACPSMEAAELLTDLFVLTAEKGGVNGKEYQRNREDLRDKLEQVEMLGIPGMEEWVQQWREKGYPAVHHSKAFNEAYHPHYRLLRKEYALYFPVLWEAYQLIMNKKSVIIGIDGRCGSGKTSLAQLMAEIFSCNVVHTDDFYLPMEERAENWTEVPGGNMDFVRLRSEVLIPAQAGETLMYRPYHCQEGVYGEALQLAPGQLLIIEGSYSHHPLLADAYDWKVFLTCSGEVQTKRLREREGSYFDMFEKRWIPMEENYFHRFDVEAGSDLVVKTDDITSGRYTENICIEK